MKKALKAALGCVLVVAVLTPAPAPAIQVHDVIHTAETVAQAVADYNYYVTVLENLEDPEWRDLLHLVHAAREFAGSARALSFVDAEVLERFFEVFPDYLAVTQEIIEAGITVEKLVNEWRGIHRDTAAGTLASVAQLARDYDDVRLSLERVKAHSNSASGTSQQLHAANELEALGVQELIKLNQSLAALIQLQAVEAGRQAALEGIVWATERSVLEAIDMEASYGDFPAWR